LLKKPGKQISNLLFLKKLPDKFTQSPTKLPSNSRGGTIEGKLFKNYLRIPILLTITDKPIKK